MKSAKTTPTSAGIGEERAMPMPAPRMKAAMAIDLPRKPVAQLSSVVYIVWNSAPVVPASADPAAKVRRRARRAVLRVVLMIGNSVDCGEKAGIAASDLNERHDYRGGFRAPLALAETGFVSVGQ